MLLIIMNEQERCYLLLNSHLLLLQKGSWGAQYAGTGGSESIEGVAQLREIEKLLLGLFLLVIHKEVGWLDGFFSSYSRYLIC